MIERWGGVLVVIAIRVEPLNTDGQPLARKNFCHLLAGAGSKALAHHHGPAAIAALVDKDQTRYNLEAEHDESRGGKEPPAPRAPVA